MRINVIHKFVYISTPKACTHTVYQMLNDHYSEGLKEYGFHNTVLQHRYWNYFKWTVVRNPFSRAVSLWWSGCRLHAPDIYGFRKGCGAIDNFTKFVVWLSETSLEERGKEPLMMNQSEWLQPVEPIEAIHMEHLRLELNQLLPFWKSDIDIPRLNTTDQKINDHEKENGEAIKRPPWPTFYKDKTAYDAVLKWAGSDFERFGYSRVLP